MKFLAAAAVTLLLGGCATMQQPKPSAPKTEKVVKHQEPCPCSPTANQVVRKRWYDGFRVRWLH
jgi:hypothetical protein